MAPYDDTRGSGSASSFEHPALEEREEKHDGRRKFYTRREMLKVIRALLKMDLATIDILYEKLKEPALKITNLGRRKHLPRQRIYSHLHKAFSIIPDLREAVNVEYGFNISGS